MYFEHVSYLVGLFACQEVTDLVGSGRARRLSNLAGRVRAGHDCFIYHVSCRVGT